MGHAAQVIKLQDSKDLQANPKGAGMKRASEEVRERVQRPRDTKRGTTKKKLPQHIDDDPLLPPIDALPDGHGLHGFGAQFYERIRAQQERWENSRGTKAFLKQSDVENLIAVAHLYHSWRMHTEEIRKCHPAFDQKILQGEIAANNNYRKGLEALGYVTGMYNHLQLEDLTEDEESLFDD